MNLTAEVTMRLRRGSLGNGNGNQLTMVVDVDRYSTQDTHKLESAGLVRGGGIGCSTPDLSGFAFRYGVSYTRCARDARDRGSSEVAMSSIGA
jgi:hypothetical protein